METSSAICNNCIDRVKCTVPGQQFYPGCLQYDYHKTPVEEPPPVNEKLAALAKEYLQQRPSNIRGIHCPEGHGRCVLTAEIVATGAYSSEVCGYFNGTDKIGVIDCRYNLTTITVMSKYVSPTGGGYL
jgi:hypothetical protein